jgi:hypothetical protein
VEVDLETAAPGPIEERPSRYRRWLSVLVGVSAVVATSFAALESQAGRLEEQAFVRANRLSIDLFARIAGSSPRATFQLESFRDAIGESLTSTSRRLAALRRAGPEVNQLARALAAARERTTRQVIAASREMARIPLDAPGIDPAFREIITTDITQLGPEVEEQNRQVDEADVHGTRQERAMFGIALVAIAAVLLGLAGLMGEGRPGRVALVAAGASLVLAVGWVASGFVVA